MTEFDLLPPHVQPAVAGDVFHSWNYPDGRPWAEFRRLSGAYLLRFPGLADFEVTCDGQQVRATPAPATSADTVEHLYLNQVLPLALNRQGALVFHASAVESGTGAIAFLAPTGYGKSTLAAAFAADGRAFLTDDALIIDERDGGYHVRPSHPSIRLWQDSRDRLLGAEVTEVLPVTYSSKSRCSAGQTLKFSDSALPLRAMYVLGKNDVEDLRVTPLTRAAALIAYSAHSFLLDVEDRSITRQQFGRVARLAESVPAFELDYPRRYEELPRIIEIIVAHAKALEPAE